MNLPTAQRYAAQIVTWLAPYCERIEIAGSIRRGLAHCNDVDLVCIPKEEIQRDMFGTETARKNLLWEFLHAHVASGKATFKSGGNQPGKFCILQLKSCQLDVYFATPETWATRLLCRTGSKEHNIFLAQRAQARGHKWEPYEGYSIANIIVPVETEEALYAACFKLPFIEPKNREAPWLAKNIQP